MFNLGIFAALSGVNTYLYITRLYINFYILFINRSVYILIYVLKAHSQV